MKKGLLIIVLIFTLFGLQKKTLIKADDLSLRELLQELKCDFPSESQIYYNSLDNQEKQHYNYILEQIIENDFGTPIVFSFFQITDAVFEDKKTQLINSIFAFTQERKEFFWLNGSYRLNMVQIGPQNSEISDYEVSLTLNVTSYYLNEDDSVKNELIKTDLIEILAVIDDVVSDTLAYNTEYERYKYIHDWLVLNNEYEQTSDLSHTPVSALLPDKGGAVCEAYAEAFLVLALKANLNAVFVTGMARSDLSSFELHAWNNVKLGSYWYLVDVTWDDPVGAPEGFIGYTYFLVPNINEVYRTIDPSNIIPTPFALEAFDNIPSYKVSVYINDVLVTTIYVTSGGNLIIPSNLNKAGYSLVFADDTTNITEDKSFYGTYVINKYKIRFLADDLLLDEQTVEYNQMPLEPEAKREGYKFKGWDKKIQKATKDMDYYAVFQKITNPFDFNNLNDTGKLIVIGASFVLAIVFLTITIRIFTRRKY